MFFRLGSFLCFANNLHKHYKKAICTNSIEKNQPKNAKQTPPTYLPYKRSVCLSSLFKTTKAFDVCFSLFLVGCYLNSSLARTASNPTAYILCRFRRFSSRAFRFRHGYIFKPCLIGRRRRAPVCRREICKHIVMFSWRCTTYVRDLFISTSDEVQTTTATVRSSTATTKTKTTIPRGRPHVLLMCSKMCNLLYLHTYRELSVSRFGMFEPVVPNALLT